MNKVRMCVGAGLLALLAVAVMVPIFTAQAADPKPDEAAVKRARKTVEMLDDIYKNTIVLITDKYVLDTDDFAAGSAAVELFRIITEKGSHTVRLLDATGDPYDAENVAKDEFEKDAIKQLKAGKAYVEKIETKDGKSHLRALTAVPVVHERCVMCHPHYSEAKKGEPIGAISYTMPLD